MKANAWDKISITLPQAGEVQAVAPVIVSASRSTDIPAFHFRWFLNRLRAGYAAWRNPFNQSVQHVSFLKTRVIVFWTKNPAPLLPHLQEIEDRGFNYYFQYTINDYEAQGWEPNVPALEERIATLARLSDRVGRDRVIWRFDPLLLSDTVTERTLVEKIERVGNLAHPYTSKMVFSFADISAYRKVRNNLASAGIDYRDFDAAAMTGMARRIAELNRSWGLELATCAEAESFRELGITHNRCIDGELMLRLFPGDMELRRFLTPARGQLTLGMPGLDSRWQDKLKDAGQRKECGCIVSKDIGAYNTCAHLCTYCYANTSERTVMKNLAGRTADEACIVST